MGQFVKTPRRSSQANSGRGTVAIVMVARKGLFEYDTIVTAGFTGERCPSPRPENASITRSLVRYKGFQGVLGYDVSAQLTVEEGERMAVTATSRRLHGITIRDGLVGGIIAGTAFILAEMFFSQMLGNPFFAPPRLISTIVLGKAAAMPGYQAVPSSVAVGFIIHYLLSIFFGIVTAWIAIRIGRHPVLGRGWTFVILGFLAGMVIWGINFYVIAPALFPQFDMVNAFWGGFVAHAIFGVVLGLYLMTRMLDAFMQQRSGAVA